MRAPIPGSGKTIVTRQPLPVSAAAISEPMKPPPITTSRRPLDRKRAELPVVVERPEVDDVVVRVPASRGASAGREEQLLAGVLVTGVVGRAPPVEVELDDPAAEHELDAAVGGAAPDLRLVAARPEPFVSGGRLYGGCGSAPTSVIVPSASCSRIPLAAASPVMPPPTIRYRRGHPGASLVGTDSPIVLRSELTPADSVSRILTPVSEPADWEVVDGALEREFELPSFPEAIAFVNRVAELAEHENHHPDIGVSYKRR